MSTILAGQVVFYQGEPVEVSAVGVSLATIETEYGKLTVPIKKLKTGRQKKGKPEEVIYPADEVKALVTFLQAAGYTLLVHRCYPEQVDDCIAEYLDWSGEKLPEEAFYKLRDDDGVFPREWRLRFYYSTEAPLFFNLVSTGGNRAGKPVGIVDRAGVVRVSYPSIIGQLVRAGLRVNPRKVVQQ